MTSLFEYADPEASTVREGVGSVEFTQVIR
jgi:hypothetical protein